jgi:hypothetical protein
MVLHRAAHFGLKEIIKPFNSKACILADFKWRDNVCHMAGAGGEDVSILELPKYRREYSRADTQIFSENLTVKVCLIRKIRYTTRRLVNELINEL